MEKTYIPCDARTSEIFESVCREMGIGRKISIVQSMSVPTARIEGVLRPRVCIPATDYPEKELRVMLKHELVHYLNHDAWIRECAVFLECMHWFTPLVRRLQSSLECWGEYCCDYRVCRQYGVERRDYINALVAEAERVVEWKEKIRGTMVMDMAFVAGENNLKERIGRIMNDKEQREQKRAVSIVLCGMFVLAGCMITFFAGTGAEVAYAAMIDITYPYSSTAEELSEPILLEEFAVTPDEMSDDGISPEGEVIARADPAGVVSAAIKGDGWRSGGFQASSGQSIVVSVDGTPSRVYLSVGIIEPDGNVRYVYSNGTIIHTFALNKTGEYQVFVRNDTSTEVTFFGHYNTKDAEYGGKSGRGSSEKRYYNGHIFF